MPKFNDARVALDQLEDYIIEQLAEIRADLMNENVSAAITKLDNLDAEISEDEEVESQEEEGDED